MAHVVDELREEALAVLASIPLVRNGVFAGVMIIAGREERKFATKKIALIQAFGNLVMSGNYLIGVIVFAILVIVNFVVITKGSGRIAEVGARFMLSLKAPS